MKYRTVVVDPPWQYRDKLGSFNNSAKGAASQYGVEEVGRIANLPLGEWAESDAHLYLWTTNAFMKQAHWLMEMWNFDQKTILTWVKRQPDNSNWLGMGHYFRNQTEHVLFGVRGRMKLKRADVGTLFYGQRGRHSEKPHAFYDMVESVSPGPYLDVFARKLRFNWDAWGDEVGAPEGLPTPEELRK